MPHRHRRIVGFTLVELLIVIGIIAVLISLLLPALSGAQRQAKSAKCLANLRSIGQAFQLYEADHKGYWPVAVHWAPTQANNETRWPDMIAKHVASVRGNLSSQDVSSLKGTVVWGCPAWTGSYEATGSASTFAEGVRTGYGMQYTPIDRQPKNMAYIDTRTTPGKYVHSRDWRVRGAERALLADSITHILEAPDTLDKSSKWQPYDGAYVSGMFTFDARRHGKVSIKKEQTWNGRYGNMLFCDGHAATVNVREAYNAVRNPGSNSTPD